jgi:hypothetical protein
LTYQIKDLLWWLTDGKNPDLLQSGDGKPWVLLITEDLHFKRHLNFIFGRDKISQKKS